MKKRFLPLLLSLMLFTLCGCTEKKPDLQRYQASFLTLFDTVTYIVGYAENEDAFRKTAEKIHDELETYHQLYDIYHTYDGINNIKTINDHPGEAIEVDQKIIDLLLFAKDVYAFSGGKTDVTMGGVLSLWHVARNEGIDDPENAELPDAEALKEAAQHHGFDHLKIDDEKNTVCITDPDMKIDVGAVAKGFSVQQVCGTIQESFLISCGGNVYASGTKPDGTLWTVGLQDPNSSIGATLHNLKITNCSVVSSGDYQRSYTVDGVKYHHIIDPDTLYPSTLWKNVTVVCPDSGLGDGLSTSLFLMSLEDGQKLLETYGAEGMWMSTTDEVFYTPGYEALIAK